MAWADVPAKLDKYGAIEYGGPVAVDRLLASYGVFDVDDLDMVPLYRRSEFEADLDYRLGACENLEVSRGWSADMLRKAR